MTDADATTRMPVQTGGEGKLYNNYFLIFVYGEILEIWGKPMYVIFLSHNFFNVWGKT